jgi:hypothetical protein
MSQVDYWDQVQSKKLLGDPGPQDPYRDFLLGIRWIIFSWSTRTHCFKFYFYSLAVEMLFFSLICPQGVNSTNFGNCPVNNQSRREGVSYLAPLVSLVHSERYRHYLAPRLRSGAALRCQGSTREVYAICNMCVICTLEKGEGRADNMHSPMTVSEWRKAHSIE